jgi:hypothetical protein
MVVNDTDGKLERMSSKATKSTWASRKTMKAARLATASTTHGLAGGRLLGVRVSMGRTVVVMVD